MKFLTTINFAVALFVFFSSRLQASDYFKISVIDEQTDRGVPLVELETVNHARWWTDSRGVIAFNELGLMGEEVYFHVRSHGYEYPRDFFGNRGVKLKPTRGGSAVVKLKRLNIAERLYRITGQGIYRDSVLLGEQVPLQHSLLNGQVMGQDTVIAAPYRGKIYWFWGDTDRVSYPLGNFGASGATSELLGQGGLDPSVGVDLTYFVDQAGFSRPMCPLPGRGLRWIEGLLTLPDETGRERLVARVANVRDLGHVNDWHLMIFNDEKEVFESVQRWESNEGHDSAHPFRARVGGQEYFYLYPNWRVKAELKSLYDLKNYEALTCVAGDGWLRGKETQLERDASGRPRYAWKAGADRLHPGHVRKLISAEVLKPEESWIDLHDYESGSRIEAGRGSVFWNEFRQRWVMLISAKAGEIWFSEGDTPTGPWAYARRVVTHENYNFYNPTQHPFFDQEGGRLIYFEGTYTASFSAAKEKTPRYDYNQIMYRLALDDSRLALPAPVYRGRSSDGEERYSMRDGVEQEKSWESIHELAFFALPAQRGQMGLVPIFALMEGHNFVLLSRPLAQQSEATRPLFFALPATNALRGQTVAGAWQCIAKTTDGAELAFTLDLTQRDTSVEATSAALAARGSGSFKENLLELSIERQNQRYSFIAALEDRKLSGKWKQLDSTQQGTWSAAWIDPTPGEHRSRLTTPLFEYKHSTGRRVYSVNPQLPDTNLKRAPEPLCRVWKNPMSVLALDPVTPVTSR